MFSLSFFFPLFFSWNTLDVQDILSFNKSSFDIFLKFLYISLKIINRVLENLLAKPWKTIIILI